MDHVLNHEGRGQARAHFGPAADLDFPVGRMLEGFPGFEELALGQVIVVFEPFAIRRVAHQEG